MEPMKRVWLVYHEAVVRPVTTTDVGTTLPVPNIHITNIAISTS